MSPGLTPPVPDLRAWRHFVAVAQELHFGRAAARLAMTQPPLTQSIAQLEAALGVRLFERTKRRVQLTAEGEALLPDVQDLLTRAQALPERARAIARGEVGRVRLAFVSTFGYERLPGWVRAYRTLHPRVTLELIEATGDVQVAGIAQGQIDAGFVLHVAGFEPEGLQRLPIAREPLWLALPQSHPLAGSADAASAPLAPAAMPALWREPLVIFPRHSLPSVYDAVFGLYHQAGQSPQVEQEAVQMQTIINLVSAGLGVAWVPQSVTQLRRPGVVYRRAPAAQTVWCETSLVWPHAPASAAVSGFVDFVAAQVGQETMRTA
ncbi:MAG: HTH-type transcriptional regulator BenM [Paracidovorax wautersii]|uniref:HTH-type transcriptional regulator BenM n=1 Tax=Paracidovorax wautersii TaxID=1177982 RepID=A0A7V8JPM3_9BURK|nr:MAG: HTH-type transcriptional regulator BenM [Paracidovorax wautersii]